MDQLNFIFEIALILGGPIFMLIGASKGYKAYLKFECFGHLMFAIVLLLRPQLLYSIVVNNFFSLLSENCSESRSINKNSLTGPQSKYIGRLSLKSQLLNYSKLRIKFEHLKAKYTIHVISLVFERIIWIHFYKSFIVCVHATKLQRSGRFLWS